LRSDVSPVAATLCMMGDADVSTGTANAVSPPPMSTRRARQVPDDERFGTSNAADADEVDPPIPRRFAAPKWLTSS
jgi:hypothetical protein